MVQPVQGSAPPSAPPAAPPPAKPAAPAPAAPPAAPASSDSFEKKPGKTEYTWGPAYKSVHDGPNVYQRGLRGPGVEEVQKNLDAAGYKQAGPDGKFDGKFGGTTEAAVKKFQTEHGISPANGVVDQKTARAIEDAANKAKGAAPGGAQGSQGAQGGDGAKGAQGATAPSDAPPLTPEQQAAKNYNKAAEMLESGKFKKGDNAKFDAIVQTMLNDQPLPVGGQDPAGVTAAQARFFAAAKKAGYQAD